MMKKVEVTWIDAQSSLDIVTIKELKELTKDDIIITKSCGYLIHKDKEKVVLAFMLFGDEFVKHYQVIPSPMIKNIRELIK